MWLHRLCAHAAGPLALAAALLVAAACVDTPRAHDHPQHGEATPAQHAHAPDGAHDHPEHGSGAVNVQPEGHRHDMPHPAQVQASPTEERLLLDAYADGSLPARVLALHQALGARLDAHDDSGQTLLMKAAARDDFPLVQALLAAEVALDATDIHGWSALEHAVQGHATEAALALLAAGAVERVDHHQNSTLQYAVNLVVDERVVAALVAAGADVNRRSHDGLTVLMEAVDAGNPLGTIRALLAAPGIDLGQRDPYGDDVLEHARDRGDPTLVDAVTAALAR